MSMKRLTFKIKQGVLFALLLFGFLKTYYAQEIITKDNSKIHYEIKNLNSYPNPDFVIQAAAEFTKFDEIRFTDRRRAVKLKNTNVIIELYSAKELKELYNKEICLLNIDPSKPYNDVELDFTSSKHPIFEIIQINN